MPSTQLRKFYPGMGQFKIYPRDVSGFIGLPMGNTYYVSSVTGNNSNNGLQTDQAFATLAYAMTQVTANNGDVIVLLPAHAESVTSATTLLLNAAGVSILGIGVGGQRATITFTTANTATIPVSANDIYIENVVFVANFLAVAACFTLTTAKSFQTYNCEFRDTSAILNFIAIYVTDTTSNHADGLTVDNCKFLLLATSGAVKLLSALGTNDRFTIKNNYYIAQTTGTGAIIPIAAGKVLTNFQLTNNWFDTQNASGTATGLIITTNGTTNSGVIDQNKEWSLATSPLLVTASSGFVYGANYHADAADSSGYLLPAADS